MNKHFLIYLSFLFTGIVASPAQDPVFNTVKTELNRNFEVLSMQSIPACYGFVRLDELQSIHTSASLGRLKQEATLNSPSRILTACIRVGDYTLDNSHELRESGWGGSGANVRGNYIPFEPNDRVLRNSIWQQLDELYKEGVQTYEQVKANLAAKVKQEDTSPDFSRETLSNRYEKPLAWADLKINPKVWEEKVRKYSAVFDENDDLKEGAAYFSAGLSRIVFVDTEGREMAQNAVSIQLFVSAHTVADDGMYLPLVKSWRVFSLDELPSDEEVLQAAREISATLSTLRKAPVVESFTGPAILSPEAAGVFFHEIFGHRVEGSRLKQENDAQTFKKKIGEAVLPKHLSVTFDPTLRYYEGQPLTGYYVFDDEGIPSQKVEVVKNGVLKDFLMSRTPIEGHDHSNGHGRGGIGYPPVSRQSNMLIQSSQRFSDDELIKKLRKEAKAQKKEYAYYFKDVSGGFTNTSRYSPNSFNVTPLIVYRVYTDGRPDELVRGVDMVGTPLAMFSQIEACGQRYAIFNGMCGAESGSIPVSCVAPALFVKQIETQKRPKDQTPPLLLSKPEQAASAASLPADSLILEAIKKEVNRGLNNLKMDGLQSPFFISYSIGDVRQLLVTASHGSLTNSNLSHSRRASNARLLMGDYQCTDENFQGTTGGVSGYDGLPVIDNDERGIRYTIWKDLDAIYKNAAETYEQKMATIKQLNIPAKDLELPDWDKTPVVRMHNFPKKSLDFNQLRYEEYARKASSVFNEYPEILQSSLVIQLLNTTIYFYNTEGSEFIYPLSFVYVTSSVTGKTEEGEDLSDSFDYVYADSDDLPPVETMQAECRRLASDLIEEIHAPKLKDAYSGPILFESLAVPAVFYSSFFSSDLSLIAERKPLTTNGFSYGGNSIEEMMGKRITAREITIEDLTGTPEYQGVKLLGYAPIDGQGVVPPARLPLVENGMLVSLLSDRVPTAKVPHSNGHALMSATLASDVNAGVIRLSDTRTKNLAELKKELFTRAQQEGYDYAYIVRQISGSYPNKLYRVNLSDGSEQRVRSAEINNPDARVFKKIIGVSNKELIYSTVAGNLLTTITPDAILFDDMQIQSDRIDNFKKAPLTPNHLSSSTKEKE
ncbi:MAG: TldD/PmbA family protein [Dysgonamonadaceae bacterium]|nr:TldD/PmbA family protein [Dysgonamonadaceae bacterium]